MHRQNARAGTLPNARSPPARAGRSHHPHTTGLQERASRNAARPPSPPTVRLQQGKIKLPAGVAGIKRNRTHSPPLAPATALFRPPENGKTPVSCFLYGNAVGGGFPATSQGSRIFPPFRPAISAPRRHLPHYCCDDSNTGSAASAEARPRVGPLRHVRAPSPIRPVRVNCDRCVNARSRARREPCPNRFGTIPPHRPRRGGMTRPFQPPGFSIGWLSLTAAASIAATILASQDTARRASRSLPPLDCDCRMRPSRAA